MIIQQIWLVGIVKSGASIWRSIDGNEGPRLMRQSIRGSGAQYENKKTTLRSVFRKFPLIFGLALWWKFIVVSGQPNKKQYPRGYESEIEWLPGKWAVDR